MRRLWLVFSQAVTVAVAVVFVLATLKPQWLAGPGESRGDAAGVVQLLVQGPSASSPPSGRAASATLGQSSYAQAARQAAPSVVSVLTQNRGQGGEGRGEPWFRRPFNEPESGMGSAVIVSADGYLLTNNHVVEGATQIEVALSDGKRSPAKVVGTDPESDLAVLKVQAEGLPAITFGDNEALQVGDVVLAIGNPFGFGKTVTLGIVSALGRQLGQWAYEDFIQTDAAINAGNSGGALVNARGELIGINTANYREQGSDAYGSQRPIAEGIGFAIPVRAAKTVMDQIIAHGLVVRGWMGAEFGPVQVAAEAGLPAAARGAMVLEVYPGSHAAEAGMQPGDVLLRLDGQDILDAAELRTREAALAPGTRVHLSGLRAGQPVEFDLALVQRPSPNRMRIPSA